MWSNIFDPFWDEEEDGTMVLVGEACMQFSKRMWVPCGGVIGQLTRGGRGLQP